jgi:hypothetical protein
MKDSTAILVSSVTTLAFDTRLLPSVSTTRRPMVHAPMKQNVASNAAAVGFDIAPAPTVRSG